jgi:hypothetical protein
MNSMLSPKRDDLQHGAGVVPPAPQNVASAEELLAKLARAAADAATNRRPGTAEADFSAGPRLAAPSLDITPRPLGNEQAASESRSRRRRGMRGPVRFLLAACIGVVATLAWQSYGAAGRHMIATLVPQLGLSSSPDMTQPLPGAADEPPAAAAAQTNAADAAPVQAAALAQGAPDPVAPQAPAVTPAAPASAEAMQQIEAMAHDITAMRQSMEQLTAAQSEMARTIAALQASQDVRREQPAPPPRPAAARKPAATTTTTQRAAQPLAPGPRPLSQSFTPSPGPPPPQPPRPPGAMP